MSRIHVVLPDDLLAEIDAIAGKRERSDFIAEILRREIRRRHRIESFDRFAGSLQDTDVPAWETREATAAWIRELRRAPDRWDVPQTPENADGDAP